MSIVKPAPCVFYDPIVPKTGVMRNFLSLLIVLLAVLFASSGFAGYQEGVDAYNIQGH